MRKIVLLAKHKCVLNNLKDFLSSYFNVDIIITNDIVSFKKISVSYEDLIIIVNENNYFHEDFITDIKVKVIVLSLLKSNNTNKGNRLNLTFPIFLPDLLSSIQEFFGEGLNISQKLSIPGYVLNIDYGDVTLKSIEFNKSIKFTFSEGILLKILFENYPKEVLKEHILSLTNYANESHTLETHILNIKSRLQQYKFSITIVKENQSYKLTFSK